MVRLGHQSGVIGHFGHICQMAQDSLHRVADIFVPIAENAHHTTTRSRLYTLFPINFERARPVFRHERGCAYLVVQITPVGFREPINGPALTVGQTQRSAQFSVANHKVMIRLNFFLILFASAGLVEHFTAVDRIGRDLHQLIYMAGSEGVLIQNMNSFLCRKIMHTDKCECEVNVN